MDTKQNEKATNKPPRAKKRLRLVSYIILFTLAGAFVFTLIFTFFTPYPVSFVIRAAFEGGMAVEPDNYAEMRDKVTAQKELVYPSVYNDNSLDLYTPKNVSGNSPVILWVHGGAFVGGDKSDIEIYATALASNGYAVACINYERAPEEKYPAPLVQTREAYTWLKEKSAAYKLDVSRLVLAGDSAGAHIAAQFAAIQTNAAYAAETGIEQVVSGGTLKATLLFCGPYNVSKIAGGKRSPMRFLMNYAAWAYFGTSGWEKEFGAQATVANHITADFPPSFISDGNTASFEDHARELAAALNTKGVPVETFFIPIEEEKAMHEYQFVMNTRPAIESFAKTLDFLEANV